MGTLIQLVATARPDARSPCAASPRAPTGRPGARRVVPALVGLALLLAAAPAAGWGEKAHRLVAGVAEGLLDEASRRAARDLVGRGGLVEAAVWADRIRAAEPHTAPWHYVNIPLAASGYDERRDCGWPEPGACVVAAIERFRALLADRAAPQAARAEALKFLVHFVADIHQPLHCLAEFRGGNDLVVSVLGEPLNPLTEEPWNLHAVWDAGLVDLAGWREDEARRRLLDLAARRGLDRLPPGTPADWAVESHRLAVGIVEGLPPSRTIGRDDVRDGLRIIERRLALAGVRLAHMIRAALADRAGR